MAMELSKRRWRVVALRTDGPRRARAGRSTHGHTAQAGQIATWRRSPQGLTRYRHAMTRLARPGLSCGPAGAGALWCKCITWGAVEGDSVTPITARRVREQLEGANVRSVTHIGAMCS